MKLQAHVVAEIPTGTDDSLEEEVDVSSVAESNGSNTKSDKCTGTDKINLHCAKCTNLKKKLHNCQKIVSNLRRKFHKKKDVS